MSTTFAQQVRDLIAAPGALSDEAARRSLSLLRELHERVLAQLAARPGLSMSDVRQLERDLAVLIRQFESRLTTDISGYVQQAWDLSDDMVDRQLATAGIRTGIVGVSTETLNIVQGLTFSEITDLTATAMKAITRELQMAALGGRSFTDLMDRIGRNLDGPSVFGKIATRAEVIARTEVGRAYEYGNQVRGNQAASVLPGLQKTWLHSTGSMPAGRLPRGMYRPRPSHVALHRVTIPWGDTFSVGGFPADGPMDATLPAREVINCKCTLVMDFSAVEDPTLRVT